MKTAVLSADVVLERILTTREHALRHANNGDNHPLHIIYRAEEAWENDQLAIAQRSIKEAEDHMILKDIHALAREKPKTFKQRLDEFLTDGDVEGALVFVTA